MGFCPKCGADAVDTFCEKCTRERTPLLADVKPITLEKCAVCDRFKRGNEYSSMNKFDLHVKKHLKFAKSAQIFEVEFPQPVFDEKPTDFDLPVAILGTLSPNIDPYVEEYEIPVKVQMGRCGNCERITSSYFEGILQVRKPRDEVVTYIEKKIQKNIDVHITKTVDVKGGIDFYFTDQTFLHAFVHELQKKFGGEVKIQSKLFSRDSTTSKNIYRLTCLLRLPNYWVGDVIETRRGVFHVKRMGKLIDTYNLLARKPKRMPCPDEAVVLEVENTVLSSVKPHPTILDPSDYQEVSLAHQIKANPGVEVPVVQNSHGKWFVAKQLDSEKE